MHTALNSYSQTRQQAIRLTLVWALTALSSVVFIEPAPYDILSVLLFAIFFSLGLRIPTGIGLALLLLGLFLLANVVASIFSKNPVESFIYMAITAFLLITWLFFTSIIYENPKQVMPIIWSGYLVAALIAVALGLLGYFKLIPYSELFLHSGRVSGTFKDANVFGPFLVPVALYLGAKLTSAIRVNLWGTLAILGLIMFGILLSFSRGAWANLVITAFAYILLRFSIRPSPAEIFRLGILGGLMTVLTVTVIVWAISTPQISDLFFERAILFHSHDIEAGGRFSALGEALEMSSENPIGIGPGQSHYFFITEPHNLFLHIFLETGWLGGISFCFFIMLTLWRSFQFCLRKSEIHDTYIIVFASVIGILIESLIVHSTHWRHLYLLLAMLWGPMLAYTQPKADAGK
jgi:O-antigen ligase